MSETSLKAYLESLGVDHKFKPGPILDPDDDALTVYFDETPSYAKRLDKWLTLFRDFESDRIVGFELKGILNLLEQVRKSMSKAVGVEVAVDLVISVRLAEVQSGIQHYQYIIRQCKQFKARIPLRPAKVTASSRRRNAKRTSRPRQGIPA